MEEKFSPFYLDLAVCVQVADTARFKLIAAALANRDRLEPVTRRPLPANIRGMVKEGSMVLLDTEVAGLAETE
jgi:hypothetical protein